MIPNLQRSFRFVLLCSVASAPMQALADSCTPAPLPPLARNTTPITVTCQADSGPQGQTFQYSSGPHLITVESGQFSIISGIRGENVLTMNGGSVTILAGNGDPNGKEPTEVILRGGTLGSVRSGRSNDIIRLFANGTTISGEIDGSEGNDILVLTGPAADTLNADQVNRIEQLLVSSGNWTYTGKPMTPFESLFLRNTAGLEIPTGETLTTSVAEVADPGSVLVVNGTMEFGEPGSPSSGVLVSGVLQGDGTLTSGTNPGSASFEPSAIINPGNSIGTLTIDAPTTFAKGATLRTEVDPAAGQNVDLLAVIGPVSGANNLTILVEPSNPGAIASDYVAANDYVVLTGTSIDGDSPTVTEGGNLPVLVDVAIVGTPSTSNQVALAFSEVPVTQLAKQPAVTQTGNPNHANLAGGLGNTAVVAPNTPIASGATLNSALQPLTNTQATQLNEVHAEPFSSYQTVALEDYDMVAGIVLGRAGNSGVSFSGFSTPENVVSRARSATVGSSGTGNADSSFWASAAYVDGSVDGENGVGDFGYSIGGLVLGADIYEDGSVQAGLFGAFNQLKLDEHDTIDQEIEGDSYHIGAYGSWERQDGWTLTGVLGFAFGDHESTRQVPGVGAFTGGTATADFDSFGYYFGAEASRDIQYGRGITITPAAAVVYARTEQDGTTETGGGDFNFTLQDSDAESLVTAFGFTASRTFDGADGRWSVIGSAHYRYDWLADENSSHDVTVSNPILGTFTQIGQNRGAHGVTAGLGLSGQVSDRVEIGAGYAYSWNENGDEHGVGASILVTW